MYVRQGNARFMKARPGKSINARTQSLKPRGLLQDILIPRIMYNSPAEWEQAEKSLGMRGQREWRGVATSLGLLPARKALCELSRLLPRLAPAIPICNSTEGRTAP